MRETFLLRIPSEIKEWLETDARAKGLTLTGLIMGIINEYKEQKTEKVKSK